MDKSWRDKLGYLFGTTAICIQVVDPFTYFWCKIWEEKSICRVFLPTTLLTLVRPFGEKNNWLGQNSLM